MTNLPEDKDESQNNITEVATTTLPKEMTTLPDDKEESQIETARIGFVDVSVNTFALSGRSTSFVLS